MKEQKPSVGELLVIDRDGESDAFRDVYADILAELKGKSAAAPLITSNEGLAQSATYCRRLTVVKRTWEMKRKKQQKQRQKKLAHRQATSNLAMARTHFTCLSPVWGTQARLFEPHAGLVDHLPKSG
jgi:hypothetical protein